MEVVAPNSAPMFVIVALPVQLMVRAPAPRYSIMWLVPPATVSSPAAHLAAEDHADALGQEHVPWQTGHHLHGIGTAYPNGAGAKPTGVGGVRVCANDELPGKGVVLQGHLVDDAGT